jgi:hypothetical protein
LFLLHILNTRQAESSTVSREKYELKSSRGNEFSRYVSRRCQNVDSVASNGRMIDEAVISWLRHHPCVCLDRLRWTTSTHIQDSRCPYTDTNTHPSALKTWGRTLNLTDDIQYFSRDSNLTSLE